MAYYDCLTITVYRDLRSASKLSISQWDEFIRQARRANVLPRLAILLKSSDSWQHIPDAIRLHLESAIVTANALRRTVMWEITHITKALQDTNAPCVYLKGAAYQIAGLPAGDGRIFNDIDFMVPKENIQQVENKLTLHGWKATLHNRYDQMYYRRWTHEIPPLKHVTRGSVLDVHHAILPKTANLKPQSELLLQRVETVSTGDGRTLKVLCPVDMVLHSATHLFHDGELEHGLRDLMDLDLLFRHNARRSGFWDDIVPRSEQLQLSLPLFYGLRYCRSILDTPVPQFVVERIEALHGHRWNNRIMDVLFQHALLPDHKSCQHVFTPLARFILYVRAHYLRMPLRLLIPHLIRKAIVKSEH